MKLLSKCQRCKKFSLYTSELHLTVHGIRVTAGQQGAPKYMCRKCKKDIKTILANK